MQFASTVGGSGKTSEFLKHRDNSNSHCQYYVGWEPKFHNIQVKHELSEWYIILYSYCIYRAYILE